MFESLASGLQFVLSTLGLVASSDLGAGSALGLTVALVSVAVIVSAVLVLAVPTAARIARAHPVRAIDVSSPHAQSDPDASGHPRPRAPGFAASAA